MTKQTLFKSAGWHVTVVSWENDADNYKTESKCFETQDQASFVVDLLKNFSSNHSSKFDENFLGNCQFFRDGMYEKYKQAVTAFIQQLSMRYNVPEEWSDYGYVDECIIYELVGQWMDGECMRVVEKIRLDYIPEDIYVENIVEINL